MFPWFEETYKQLSLRLRTQKLHHALLLQGPAGLGKSKFAMELAKLLLCTNVQEESICGACQSCLLNAALTHPDLHIVESEKQIGVDQIRDAIRKLVGSAQMSGAKVLIIYQADTMTESSANALLKTLEEPTDNTYLLLTSDKPERILPTIKSRCEKMILPTPDLDCTINWVQKQISADVDIDLAKLFMSRPLALLEELQEEKGGLTYDTFCNGIRDIGLGQMSAMQLAIKWQEDTEKVIKWIQYWARQQCNTNQSDRMWHLNIHAAKVIQLLRNPGVNKTLLLTELLDRLTQKMSV